MIDVFIQQISFIRFFFYSVNKISSLADFEDCHKLQELYLRKNNIKEINDLVYLQVNRNFNTKTYIVYHKCINVGWKFRKEIN